MYFIIYSFVILFCIKQKILVILFNLPVNKVLNGR